MQVGTTRDQGLYNKPLAAGSASGGISRWDSTTIQTHLPKKTFFLKDYQPNLYIHCYLSYVPFETETLSNRNEPQVISPDNINTDQIL